MCVFAIWFVWVVITQVCDTYNVIVGWKQVEIVMRFHDFTINDQKHQIILCRVVYKDKATGKTMQLLSTNGTKGEPS